MQWNKENVIVGLKVISILMFMIYHLKWEVVIVTMNSVRK